MGREISLKAGENYSVIKRRFSSVPLTYTFSAKSASGESPKGFVEVRGSRWVLRKNPERHPLAAENQFSAGFWDTFYDIVVYADEDLRLGLPKRSGRSALLIGLIAVLIVAVAAALLFVY